MAGQPELRITNVRNSNFQLKFPFLSVSLQTKSAQSHCRDNDCKYERGIFVCACSLLTISQISSENLNINQGTNLIFMIIVLLRQKKRTTKYYLFCELERLLNK